MGPYKPLRTWVDEFIPYYMEMSWELIDPIAQVDTKILANWPLMPKKTPGRHETCITDR